MEYSVILGVLAAFFGVVGAFAVVLKRFSPQPPPRGGITVSPRMSFSEFRHRRGRASQEDRQTITAQRRLA
jgi:hypothetical protein